MTAFLIAMTGALAGVVATGLVKLADQIAERRRIRQALLAAFASDVAVLCLMIRTMGLDHRYDPLAGRPAQALALSARQPYLSVFDALASQLPTPHPDHAGKIIRFYQTLRILIDATAEDNVMLRAGSSYYPARTAGFIGSLVTAVLDIGDAVVKLPRPSIPFETALARA